MGRRSRTVSGNRHVALATERGSVHRPATDRTCVNVCDLGAPSFGRQAQAQELASVIVRVMPGETTFRSPFRRPPPADVRVLKREQGFAVGFAKGCAPEAVIRPKTSSKMRLR